MTPLRFPSFYLFLALAPFLGVDAKTPLPSAERLSADERRSMQRETRIAIDLLGNYHYKKMPWVEVDSAELLTDFMESLDGQKMFFLQDDYDFVLERFETTLKPSYLFVGDLYPAFEIYDLYQERVLDRLAWVKTRLEEPFDLQREETFNTDREEATWPKTAAEANALWEDRLTYDLISQVLEGETQEQALKKIARRYDRREKMLNDFEPHNIQETFLTSLTGRYDPHSTFFSWDSAQEFDIEISNSLTGIGAQLREVDGYCVVERIIPGGPAEQSGMLHPGDKIVEVAQGNGEPVDVVGMKLRRIVHLIRGEVGSKLRLTIEPPGAEERRFLTLTRDRIELSANLAKAEIFEVPFEDRTRQIGVIELPSFYGEGEMDGKGTSTSQDVNELLGKLKESGIEGLVVDLRRNGGGRLDEAVALTGLFIEQGPVVIKRSFDGTLEEDWDRNPSVSYDGPLVVLTSKMSASASEIMAGALQSYGRAVVVGDTSTYGKGTVQTLVPLDRTVSSSSWRTKPKWGMVKLTIQQYYLPNGASTQQRGVLSDIILPSIDSALIQSEADKPHALEWDELTHVVSHRVEESWDHPVSLVDEALLGQLRERSEARQIELPEFDFFQRQLAWRTEVFERKEYPLNIDVRRVEKEAFEAKRRAFEDERRELSSVLGLSSEQIDLAVSRDQDAGHQLNLRESLLPDGKARMNRFFQKVFYYEETPGADIEEIWVEYIDYRDAEEHAAELAEVFSKSSGLEVAASQMAEILLNLKNADRGGAFDVTEFFASVLGEDAKTAQIEAGLSDFFRRVVELDPDILDNRPPLDIHLRESLRIVQDWIELAGAASGKSDSGSMLAKAAEVKEPISATN